MRILKELDDAKLVIVELEVRLGEEIRSAPTLCAKYKGKIIPLNTAHDGRPDINERRKFYRKLNHD